MEYSILDAKEKLNELFEVGIIEKKTLDCTIKMLENCAISPSEVIEGYIPYIQGEGRYR